MASAVASDVGIGTATGPQAAPVALEANPVSISTPAPSALGEAPSGPSADGFSAAQVASARAAWLSYGLDAATFDRAAGLAPVASEAGLTDYERHLRWQAGEDTGGARTAAVAPAVVPSVSLTEAHTLAQQLEASGMSEADVAATLARAGYVPDTRTDIELQWDTDHGFRDAIAPSDYHINIRQDGLSLVGQQPAVVAEIAATWQQFLSATQINALVGPGLIDHVAAQSRQLAQMTEGEREMWTREQAENLSQHCGGDAEAVQVLKREAGHAITTGWNAATDKGKFATAMEALHNAGAFQSSFFLQMLANHGRNLAEWGAGRAAGVNGAGSPKSAPRNWKPYRAGSK